MTADWLITIECSINWWTLQCIVTPSAIQFNFPLKAPFWFSSSVFKPPFESFELFFKLFGSDRSSRNADVHPRSPPSQNQITAFQTNLGQITAFRCFKLVESFQSQSFNLRFTYQLKVVIWVIWRQWSESFEGSDISKLKVVLRMYWRLWSELSKGGDLSQLKEVIWVSWRWWSEQAEDSDLSHLKAVIWVSRRWC